MDTLLHCHTTPMTLALDTLGEELAKLREDHYCHINSSRMMPFMQLRNQVLATLNAYDVFLQNSHTEERKLLTDMQPLFALLGNLDIQFTRYAGGSSGLPWQPVLAVIEQVLTQPAPALPTFDEEETENELTYQQP